MPRKIVHSTPRIFTQEEARDMASMIDGAYEIIQLFGYNAKEVSQSQVEWAKQWCEKALKYGAISW